MPPARPAIVTLALTLALAALLPVGCGGSTPGGSERTPDQQAQLDGMRDAMTKQLKTKGHVVKPAR